MQSPANLSRGFAGRSRRTNANVVQHEFWPHFGTRLFEAMFLDRRDRRGKGPAPAHGLCTSFDQSFGQSFYQLFDQSYAPYARLRVGESITSGDSDNLVIKTLNLFYSYSTRFLG